MMNIGGNIKRLRQRHNLTQDQVAEKLCDRIGIINKGKLIFVGTYEEMKAKFKENASLEELFLEITD